jgi:hypothetical protein
LFKKKGDGGGIPVEFKEMVDEYYKNPKEKRDYEIKRIIAVKEHLRRFAYISSDVLVMVDETSWANREKFNEMKRMAIDEATKDVSSIRDMPCLVFVYNKAGNLDPNKTVIPIYIFFIIFICFLFYIFLFIVFIYLFFFFLYFFIYILFFK